MQKIVLRKGSKKLCETQMRKSLPYYNKEAKLINGYVKTKNSNLSK